MDQILSFLSDTLPTARTLEQLTRPLLTLLNQVTGMESTYLTTIDTDKGVQRVEFARNVGDMVIPEGLVVPWADTLCKRALDENRMYSDNVAEIWGDLGGRRSLGYQDLRKRAHPIPEWAGVGDRMRRQLRSGGSLP
ncbi:hypothetical protein [Pseudomonas sp. TH10]|uniref:hypothetical protein n=1 Tax=Pseudomonas sp. TH10 TaxID=2796376 RepID=UPI001F5B85EB|nr:hypothetical protein [Pseudomonas sp. TH10]